MSGFRRALSVFLLSATCIARPVCGAEWTINHVNGGVQFVRGGATLASYHYADDSIPRPYFANLQAPVGVRVTRNHPPIPCEDRMDHPTLHPGVWLAFGDLNGEDNWRLKVPVEHVCFVVAPVIEEGVVRFAVENRYIDSAGAVICRSHTLHTLRVLGGGLLLTFDSVFYSDRDFAFGDQEEMGLGVRVATPLRVERAGPDPAPHGTGQITADGGRRGSGEVWGQPAAWVDYSGQLDGAPAGVTILCHPGNFRGSRMHARDYGFVCANPFATAAFGADQPSVTTVQPGESLRLRYGVFCHAGERFADAQADSLYQSYSALTP